MSKCFVIAALILSSLTGDVICQQKKSVVPTPDMFRGDTGQAASQQSMADSKWFELFKDSQLQELIRTALVENYDLRDSLARIAAARANLGITRSNQFPNVYAGADLTTLRNSTSGAFPLPQNFNQNRTFGGVLLNLLSFEIDIWGRRRRQTEAARAELRAFEAERKAVMTMLVSDVAAAYFSLLELDMELEIARRTLAARQDSLRLISARQQGGVATMLDVRQAEQLVHTASQTIPDTERLIEQTENQIRLLLGRNPGSVQRGQQLTAQEQPSFVPAGLPSSLLERRPDIKAAEHVLAATDANIGVAKAAYFPQISLTGLMGFQSNQLSSLFGGPARVWQFIPQISQPIFTAGRLKSNVRLARAQQQSALIRYEGVVQTAFREVSDALIQYRKIKEIRAQQELLVTTLQDRSRLAYLRYRGGVDTLLNALDADRDLFNAELSLAQTRRDELLSLVQLYKALGGGWQE